MTLQQIEQRMASGVPFTYGQLCAGSDGDEGRVADKAIQRWRKKGWISFRREGRQTIWDLTFLGIAETRAIRLGAPSHDQH